MKSTNNHEYYKANISTGWALCRKSEIIRIFKTEEALMNFWEERTSQMKLEYYSLETKSPPPNKIGDLYFEKRRIVQLKEGHYKYRIQPDSWELHTDDGTVIANFDTEESFKKWRNIFDEWWYKQRPRAIHTENKDESNPSQFYGIKKKRKGKKRRGGGIRQKREIQIRKELVATESYRKVKKPFDWWREQS